MKRTLMVVGLVVAVALIVAMAFVQFNQTALADEVGSDGDGMGMDPAEPDELQGKIHVTGQAVSSVAPDIAVLRLGVEAMSTSSVTQAHSRASTAMNAMLIALAGSGVDTTTDVRTTHFNISPQYDWTDDGRKLIGYVASQGISVTVRDLDSVGAAIDVAVMAGGNEARFDGLEFVVEDDADVMSELRENAYEDARTKAEHLAGLATLKVVGAISITLSSGGPVPGPLYAEAAYARADTTISPGQIELSQSVQVTFITTADDISVTPEPLNGSGTPASGGS